MLSLPRVLASVRDMPVADDRWSPGPVGLLRMRAPGAETEAAAAGATRARSGWSVPRSDPFPFERLSRRLPRIAQLSLVPDVVDLIPASSWFASLANMLVGSSWDDLRLPVLAWQGGCQECGVRSGLEGHESWSYDAGTGRQTLRGIRSLCSQCHDTQHLGRAGVAGRFDRAFGRLCRINRVRSDERSAYRDMIFDRWSDRSRRSWEIDLSIRPGMVMRLKSSIEYGGDNWLVQPADARRCEVVSRIVNAEVLSDRGRLVLVPCGTTADLGIAPTPA